MKEESGIDSGARNFGRLCLSFIPWALGIGFLVWFIAWVGVAKYKHDLLQETRAAVYVGAEEKPQEKMVIEAINHDCTVITRADVNGTDLMLYAKSKCRQSLSYLAWHWKLLSPDGTGIAEGYTNRCPITRSYGDKSECKLRISDDDRGSVLRIWTSKDTD